MKKNNEKLRRMTFSALYMALALVLPFITGQVPQIGSMLCPMHIPALLCGFVCGWQYGLVTGFISPLLRSVLFGMPGMYPTAIAMAFELAAYGASAGLAFSHLPAFRGRLYVVLVAAMLSGRLVWGLAEMALLGFTESGFTLAMFFSGAFVSAVPGIILQLIIIPPLVSLMGKTGLILNRQVTSSATDE